MAAISKLNVGLALGSGGARGYAHIGVIKTLEANNIPIDIVTGCSIGSVIGGFYAAGLTIDDIENIALTTKGRKVFAILAEPRIKQRVSGKEQVEDFLENYLSGKTFKDCCLPFAALATDVTNGESVVLNSGRLTPAIRASISVPGAFKPISIDGKLLADGGLAAPVPVKTARDMGADVVIAVNLDSYYHADKWPASLPNITSKSLSIMSKNLASYDCADADVVIDINVGNVRWFEFSKAQSKIDAGEKAALAMMTKIKNIVNK